MEEEPSYSKHFILYSLTYATYGLVFTGIGPLIPYLAENSHRT
jgi:hypothetical protein